MQGPGTLLWLSVAALAFSSQNSHASPETEQVVSLYYVRPQVKDCEMFKLSVNLNLIPEKEDYADVYMLKIEVLYKDKEQDATMSILDIGLPTGFIANSSDLDALSTGVTRSKSEMGSIIIYLDTVSHVRPEEIAFRIIQPVKMGILQPAAVSVYEYYNQKPCIRFYHPEKTQARLLQLCSKNKVHPCTCVHEACCMQKDKTINDQQRNDMACNDEVDYLYKVRVESTMIHEEDDSSVDIYHMSIVNTLKEGTDMGVQEQQRREFISPPHCRAYLGLQTGKTYLIMGFREDLHRNADNNEYQYVLGERTWIEYWPSPEECQRDEYRPVCRGMQNLGDQLTFFGCQA